MSYSRIEYTANGGVGPYSVPFSYLDKSHVEVYVGGALKVQGTDYTLPTSATVQFSSGQTSGQIILIKRNTPKNSRLVNFQDASVLTEAELDRDSDQCLFVSQEAFDVADSSLVKMDLDGAYTASGRRIKNVANPVEALDVVTKSYVDSTLPASVAGAAASASQAASSASAAEASASQAASHADALTARVPELGSYALLRAYNGAETAFHIKGVANTFDGGAGIFRVVAGDTTSADNGGTLLVDATGRRWKRESTEAVNIRWFGAKGDGVTNDASAIQAAVTYATASGKPLHIPPGIFAVASTIVITAAFGMFGDDPNTCIIRSVDMAAPCFDIQVNGSSIESAFARSFQMQAYFSSPGVSGAGSSAFRISGDGSTYFQWGRFSDLVLLGFEQAFDIAKATRTTAFGQECNVAWTTWHNITIRSFSRSTTVGFNHRLGSGTGNTWDDIKATVAGTTGIVWSFGGTGCVVGDILISNCHLGGDGVGARGVYVGDNTVYRQRIAMGGNQWDANLDVPLLVSATASVKVSNLSVSGNNHGGGSNIYAGLQDVIGESAIDDIEAGYWRIGKRVQTSSTGSLTVDCFQVDIAAYDGAEIRVVAHGFVQGVSGGAVVKRFLVRHDGASVSATAMDSARNPNVAGFLDITTTPVTGGLKVSVTLAPTGGGTDFAAQLVVTGGRVKVKRF